MSFKIFLIWSSGGPCVQWSGTIYAILQEGIMRNIHVKLCEILDQLFGRRCCLKENVYRGRTTEYRRPTHTGRRPITIPHTKNEHPYFMLLALYHHISVIVTVCRGPCALGIYSTHGIPSFMHPLWLLKRNSGCILPLSYAYFALSESVGH